MLPKTEFNRREFLKTTARASAGIAALGGTALAGFPAEADALPVPRSAESALGPKANWPQEYTVERDDKSGQLILSTPYYSVHHDLKQGGAITRISYLHGPAPNLLLKPIASSVELAAKELPQHITERAHPQPPETFVDLHDSSPSVSVTKAGKFQTVSVKSTLRTADGRDVGVRAETTYQYRWGYIKIHKTFIFPEQPVKTAGLTVLATMLHPSLTPDYSRTLEAGWKGTVSTVPLRAPPSVAFLVSCRERVAYRNSEGSNDPVAARNQNEIFQAAVTAWLKPCPSGP